MTRTKASKMTHLQSGVPVDASLASEGGQQSMPTSLSAVSGRLTHFFQSINLPVVIPGSLVQQRCTQEVPLQPVGLFPFLKYPKTFARL